MTVQSSPPGSGCGDDCVKARQPLEDASAHQHELMSERRLFDSETVHAGPTAEIEHRHAERPCEHLRFHLRERSRVSPPRAARIVLVVDSMAYMLLIMEPPGQRRQRTEEEGRALHEEMLRFSATLERRGLLKIGQSLRSDAAGVRLRVREGKKTLVDGPFAEAKEMVGGFFLLDCESRDQAIAIAAECPAARFATVEVRELGPCYT